MTQTKLFLAPSNVIEETFIRSCALASHDLELGVFEELYDFKTQSNVKGFLLFNELPEEESQQCLLSYGSALGEPYSYVQEGNGRLIHEITPVQGYEKEISSKSSQIDLDFHTELVFHHFIPDYLMLFCIRGDRRKEAKTYVSSVRNSLKDISPHLEEVLRQPIYRTGIDHSFGNKSTTKGNGKIVPILHGDASDPLLNFDPDMMVTENPDGQRAIQELREILYENKSTLILEAGEMVIIDNKRAVHGRSCFTPFYDGKDRYLQRLFVTKDLSRAHEIFGKKERIITYRFD